MVCVACVVSMRRVSCALCFLRVVYQFCVSRMLCLGFVIACVCVCVCVLCALCISVNMRAV